ncbi:RagB/SusD family nutrient uptake outer membrane protein [Proteiniphilum sp.]|uniref:RagB/SusD family nutrient uptake outer membrane protein n=1 Tax=Proteiniphilum sp. TaxID=1926877 RepID=UPI0033223634
MKNLRYSVIIIFFSFITACNNYLDVVPDMIATIEDNAFSMRSQAEKFFFMCYSYLPNSGSYNDDPALLGGDEIWLATQYTDANNAKNLALGAQRSGSPLFDFWRGINGGRNLYRGISDCNIFLANIDRVPDITLEERNRWVAEVDVIKAWLHFYLIRMYGPIAIKDVNLSVQDDTEVTHVFRNTMDECVEYCVDKMDDVLSRNHLMITVQDQATELGRITKGVALTMKAKMLVTFASPLFNGNTDYAGLTDRRGIEIFNPNKTEEEKTALWVRAADACKEAIDFFDEIGQNELYRYTGTQFGNISEQTRLKLSIRGSLVERWNEDVIWADSRSWPQAYQLQAYPRDFNATQANSQTTNRNNFAVPLKIVDQFYTKNGVPMREDKTWDYISRFTPKIAGTDQLYYLQVGEATAGMFFDREPRLYASIGFDRGIWFGQGNTSETGQAPHARSGEYSGNQISHSWNVTGIWPKKILHWLTVCSGTTTVTYTRYPFPVFRLPDLYLMYAEALNEAYNTQEARNEAIRYIDLVRERAGLEGVTESWSAYSTDPSKYQRQNGLREIVRQEKLIEFVFEGHRFWDLRRWKMAMDEYNKPVTGWNLDASDPALYYRETWIYTRNFTPKDYFWPISDEEILRNKNTLQNYGW